MAQKFYNIFLLRFEIMVSGQLPPRKITPQLGLGVGLGLVFGLGGNFPRGQLS